MITLPRGWASAQISVLGEVQLGRQRSPEHHQGEHMRPYLRVANVFEDRIDTSDVLSMNFSPVEYDRYALKRGDVLLNEGQSRELVGRPAIYRDEVPGACFQNTLVRFRVGPALIPEFALTVFRHYFHSGTFSAISKWTTSIAHLGAERFAALDFPVPPLGEQHRIVAKLDALFARSRAVKASLERLPTLIERLRQSTWAAALTGELIEHASNSSVWPKLRLSELAIPGRKIAYGVLKPGPHVTDGVRLIKSGQVRDGYMDLADEFRISSELDEQFKKTRLEGGEVLLNLVGASIGRSAVAPVELRGANVSRAIAVIPVRPGLAEWVQLALEGPEMQRLMDESKGGSAQPVLNLAEVKDLLIPVPPDTDLKRALSAVRVAKRQLAALEELANGLSLRVNTLDKAMLSSAFRGELVPQDPNDEPASVLLERIRAERAASAPVKGKRGAKAPARPRAPKATP